jgi:AraC-like DNA-binding protein
MSEVTYSKKNDEIECVRYEKSQKAYLPHTHPKHMTIGYIEEGRVCITIDGESCIYEQGEEFRIMPNVLHEIKPADEEPYSMMVMCIKTDAAVDDDNLKELQDSIMEKPENIYLIEEMAADTQVSPYHMIRKFKKAFGLTPHQFQIQCKVRKAQKLLETNKSIPEVAYEAGFCDQSHLDRCFQKIVGMTPSQYQDALENDN